MIFVSLDNFFMTGCFLGLMAAVGLDKEKSPGRVNHQPGDCGGKIEKAKRKPFRAVVHAALNIWLL